MTWIVPKFLKNKEELAGVIAVVRPSFMARKPCLPSAGHKLMTLVNKNFNTPSRFAEQLLNDWDRQIVKFW